MKPLYAGLVHPSWSLRPACARVNTSKALPSGTQRTRLT